MRSAPDASIGHRRRKREAHPELAPLPFPLAVRLHRSAVHGDQRAHQGQAQAEPSLGAIEGGRCLAEHVEDRLQVIGRDPHARITNDQDGAPFCPFFGLFSINRDVDPTAARRVLDGVGDQIDHHLLEPHDIAFHRDRHRRGVHSQRQPVRVGHRLQRLDAALNQRSEDGALLAQNHLARGHPGDVEEVVDQPIEVRGLTIDRVGVLDHPAVGHAPPHDEIGRELHRRERVPQLMAQHGQELIPGLDRPPRFVLAGACPQRAAYGGQEGPSLHRPIDERDVADGLQPLQHLQTQLARQRAEDHDRQVRPGGLRAQQVGELAHAGRGQLFLGDQDRAEAGGDLFGELLEGRTSQRFDLRPREHLRRQRSVAADRRVKPDRQRL